MRVDRRRFLKTCAALGGAAALPAQWSFAADDASDRRFHLCASPDVLDADPDLLHVVRAAGVTDIWMASFLYGYWVYTPERLDAWHTRIEALGMGAHVVTVPLGHPGDSLGAMDGHVPLTPPTHWKQARGIDGTMRSGTSLHPPATEENVAAVKRLGESGVRKIFLDDDFRLAVGPGVIGGCFCDDHRRRFLDSGGYEDSRWDELLEAVQGRSLTPLVRAWVDFTCDELTACFRAQREAAPGVDLGIMVMWLGAEKAGIRLDEYRDVMFRVGELMFNDRAFAPVKGKTDELFSALFHRRFARPERAYSETTAFPADQLSAANMAAKLAVSTLADVRHTMYMSGLSPFPKTHWDTLGPAMARHAAIHRKLAGHTPAGPFKHYWGEHARYVGDDKPFSLFLASGVPFEVTTTPADHGWTFLCDHDVRGGVRGAGTTFVARPEAAAEGMRALPENLESIFAFKREILSRLKGVPYVVEDVPVVCAWYPTARAVMLWNLTELPQEVTLTCGKETRIQALEALGAAWLEGVNQPH